VLTYEYYLDDRKQWRWHAVSDINGNIIADSGESYFQLSDCLNAIKRMEVGDEAPATNLLVAVGHEARGVRFRSRLECG
jgi:uncharacterized protein YegP (UPF0339 family)